jgi:hypothetical protein
VHLARGPDATIFEVRVSSFFLVAGPFAFCAGAFACSADDFGGADAGSSDAIASTDASADVPVVPLFDAGTPACFSDGGFPRASAVPAFGSFSGPNLGGEICSGGAFAYLERTQGSSSVPSQILFILDPALSGDFKSFIHFDEPANATSGELSIFSGVSAAAPGSYGSANGSCGSVVLCVSLPIPAGVDCGDAGSPSSCPPGCSLTGPVSGLTCNPITPENCYSAQGTSDCVLGTQAPSGSWTLNLSSVESYDSGAGGGGIQDYRVHGTFTSSLPGDDAGLGTATVSMSF